MAFEFTRNIRCSQRMSISKNSDKQIYFLIIFACADCRGALIVSCIINVDQDVDEDWPLEVYDHQGWAQNITLKPGQMLMYEVSTFTDSSLHIIHWVILIGKPNSGFLYNFL